MSGRFKNVFRGSNDPRKFFLPNTNLEKKREGFLHVRRQNVNLQRLWNEFTFTAGEQEFYAEKGFQNEPARCKDCRMARKNASGRNGQRREVVMYDTICAECGKETQVPFKPTNARPVYCKECFDAKRQ